VQRVSTTVVTLVGAGESTVGRLGGKANIAVYQPDVAADAMDRAVAAWQRAKRTHTTYFVHDADPLTAVADAWGRYFEGTGPIGELELSVSGTVARWKAGSLELPDYYVVCSPEEWSPVRRDWYLGFLASTCAVRVVTQGADVDVATTLPTLLAARWWPDLDRLLDGIEQVVPDRAGLPGQAASATRSTPAGTQLTTLPSHTGRTPGP
jgi:hypothetical protein